MTTDIPSLPDFAARDAVIAVNTYTTVLRRRRCRMSCSRPTGATSMDRRWRVPGLAWYVQYHLDREQDAHLWRSQDGMAPFPDYVLDGGVEIGFASEADQQVFNEASSILFSDEQNMFAATVAYALPEGLTHLRRPHTRTQPQRRRRARSNARPLRAG
ncbi:hypothetical protein AB5I41_25095 [Sphingomonas sp. MMS24-JH45]